MEIINKKLAEETDTEKAALGKKEAVYLLQKAFYHGMVIAGKRDTYLSSWYWRIRQKKGAKKPLLSLQENFS